MSSGDEQAKAVAVVEAMVVLDKAEKQFAFYAEEHRKKGSDDKAATNYGYSLICGRALEHLKLRFTTDSSTAAGIST